VLREHLRCLALDSVAVEFYRWCQPGTQTLWWGAQFSGPAQHRGIGMSTRLASVALPLSLGQRQRPLPKPPESAQEIPYLRSGEWV